MTEIRKNVGKARLEKGSACCLCDIRFKSGDEYTVDHDTEGVYYSHLICRELGTLPCEEPIRKAEEPPKRAKKVKKEEKAAIVKPNPDVEFLDRHTVRVYYRGHLYDARRYFDPKDTKVNVWGLFHWSQVGPLVIERDLEVGFGGIVSWLLHNR